ncbi:MAG: ATP-binding protein [Verrucomicrobiota bacterium]|nr:ATP-binding protein [Verrucomicrobiota bacterium]
MLAADIPQYTARLWQTDDGLPQNFAQTLAQTRDGYLWIGTQQGVCRFDGIRFNTFRQLPESFLASPSFVASCESRDGSLWLGTENHGLLQLNGEKLFSYGRREGFNSPLAKTICESKDGSLWIGSDVGLTHFKNRKFTDYTQKDGLLSNIVRAVCEDREGHLWIGTDNGLNMWRNGTLTSVEIQNGLTRNSIRAIYESHDGNIWLGVHGGLTRMNHGAFAHFTKAGSHSENIINTIYEDSKGNLWVGSYTGLNRLVDGKLVTELNHDGTPFDLVYSIMEDRENNIWVGTRSGLYRLRPRRFTTLTTQQGLSNNNITSICEDAAGKMWIGTWGGGLTCMTSSRTVIYNSTNGLGSDFVLGLGADRAGGIWIGTPFDVYSLKYFKDGQFIRYGKNEGFLDASVSVICEDAAGNVWIGARGALNRFQNGKFTRYTPTNGLLGRDVRVIREMDDGTLFFGTELGLTRFQNGRMFPGSISSPVNSLFEDTHRDLWVALSGEGIIRPHAHGMVAYSTKEGLPTDTFYELIDDDFGYIWMTSRNGIFRMGKRATDDFDVGKLKSLACRSFGKADGMASAECNNMAKPSAWKSKDGRLWFATTKGVAIVKPETIDSNKTPPPVVIEEVISDKARVLGLEPKVLSLAPENSMRTPLDTRHKTQDLILKPGRGELEIHYTALSFCAPEKNQFKYKLDGIDPDWVEAGTRRFAYYSNLRPGNYIFHVQGCNNDGVWNQLGAKVKLTLQPHYWQTWWFKLFVVVTSLSLVAASARFFTKRRMQLKLERLEHQHAVEKERTRIAQDMHDDLGARLSEILLVGSSAKNEFNSDKIKSHLVKITDATRDLVDNLDAIVWAVNPRNDSLNKFVLYVCEYAQIYLEASSVRYVVNLPDQLPESPLSSEARHNLFLVIKEALHNIVKHAQASEARLSLQVRDATLSITIEDNGKGFSNEANSLFGNGLSNMEERIKNMGGHFNLTSQPGQGTRIHLQIPIFQH